MELLHCVLSVKGKSFLFLVMSVVRMRSKAFENNTANGIGLGGADKKALMINQPISMRIKYWVR